MKAAAGVVVMALAATACGGGSSRLSKPEFRAKANAICAKYDAKIKTALQGIGNDPQALANGMERAIAYIKQGTKELDALNPPKDYDAKYKEFQRLNHDQITTGEKLPDAARKNDQKTIRSVLTQLESESRDSDRLATEMGVDKCASG